MIKKTISYIGIFFLSLLSILPLSILYILARFFYYLIYYVIGYRKKVVRDNLTKSFPEKTPEEIIRIEKKFFKYFADLIFEIVKTATMSAKEIKRRVNFKNTELINAYFERNESILACTGHYNNWELCMLALGVTTTMPAYVIYKPISNTTFEKWFLGIRCKFGNVFVAMKQTLRMISCTKTQPTMFCFASDQTPVREEVRYNLEFLNQQTAVLLGLEKIALQTNRPVFYFEVKLIKRGYYEVEIFPVCLEPKLSVDHEITDTFFRYLEKTIKDEPAYWLWSHRRWKLNN